MAYLLRLVHCLATTNQPDTPLFFNCSNTRFGYTSYKGGYWDFYILSNGGFYLSLSDVRTYHVIADNFFEGDLSSNALSISACLYAYSHLSFVSTVAFSDTYADMYHKLRQFMLDHHEARKILSATD